MTTSGVSCSKLSTLAIEIENYGALFSILVLEKLPHDVKLIDTRILKRTHGI